MFYNYARWVLSILGALIGLTGYYLDTLYAFSYKGILWIAMIFIFAIGGFVIGGLIRRLSISSHTDFLTGLWNRRYFYLRLNEAETRAARNKAPLCIAMIDVDRFKQINDAYGHAIGDVLLYDLASILRRNTRDTDIVARWGGDEFAIIFFAASLEHAAAVMERVRGKVEAAFSPYQLTISVGIIELQPALDLKDLLIKADQALYKAKEQKNTVITVMI